MTALQQGIGKLNPDAQDGSYADGQSVTTQYALDGDQVLTAKAAELTTAYLYGLAQSAN